MEFIFDGLSDIDDIINYDILDDGGIINHNDHMALPVHRSLYITTITILAALRMRPSRTPTYKRATNKRRRLQRRQSSTEEVVYYQLKDIRDHKYDDGGELHYLVQYGFQYRRDPEWQPAKIIETDAPDAVDKYWDIVFFNSLICR